VIAYKFLRSGGRTLFSRQTWPLPAGATPGAWLEAAPGPLEPCRNGVHACEVADLPYWLAAELWTIELDEEAVRGPDAWVARRGRLLHPVAAWGGGTTLQFAEACVQRVEAQLAGMTAPIPVRSVEYADQARSFVRAGYTVATIYAAALSFATLAPPEAEATAFRAERAQQAVVLGRILGL
jgi:hypothetical protein